MTLLTYKKRQGNLLNSIMTNFSDAEKVIETTNNSAGSAEAEHEKKLKSLDGRLALLQSHFEELSNTIMESDVIKGFIDGLTKIVDLLNTVSSGLGGMPALLVPITSAFSLMNKKTLFKKDGLGNYGLFWNVNSKALKSEVEDITKVITQSQTQWNAMSDAEKQASPITNVLSNNLKGLNAQLTRGVAETGDFNRAIAKVNQNASVSTKGITKLKSAVVGFKNIAMGIGNVVASVGIGMAISLAVNGIMELINADKERMEKASQDAEDLVQQSKELKSTTDEIKTLKEQLADSNTTTEQAVSIRKQLYDIQKNLVEQFGVEASSIDLVRDSVDELNNSFDELSKKKLEQYALDNAKAIQDSVDSIFGENSISSYFFNTGNESVVIPKKDTDRLKTIFKEVLDEKYISLSDATTDNATLDRFEINLGSYIKNSGGTKFDLVQKQQELLEYLENYKNNIANANPNDTIVTTLDEVITKLSDAKNYWSDDNYNKQLEKVNNYAEYLIVSNDAESKLYNAVKFAKEDYEKAITDGTEKDIKQAVSNYQNAISDIQTEIETLGSTGSDGAKKSFLQNIVDSANVILAEDNYKLKFQANENGIKDSIKTAIKQFNNGKEVSKEDILNFNANIPTQFPSKQLNSEQLGFVAIKNAADDAGVSLETYTQWLENLGVLYTTPVKESYNFTKILDMTADKMTSVKNKIDEIQSTFKTVKEVIEDYNDTGILSIDNAQKLIELGDDYINYLFDENGNLHINKQAYEDLTKAKVDEIKATLLKTAIDNIKQIKDEASAVEYLSKTTNDSTKATKDYTVAILENYYAQGMASKNKKVREAVSKIYETYSNYDKILNNVSTSYDDNEEKESDVTDGLEKQKDALDKSKKALEKQKDALDKQKKSLEDNKEALDDLNDSYEKDKDYIEELISLTVDMLKQRYEDEKDAIEKSKEAYRDKIDSLKEAIDDEEKLYERERDLADRNKNIATLEKQAASLTGTQSVEGIQRLSEISSDLEKARQDLADTQRSNSVEDRQNAYDDEYDYREQIWDKEIEKLDEILKNERQLRLDAMALIDTKSQEFYNNLWGYVYKYTTKSRFEFDNLWNSAYEALDKYGFGQYTCLQIMQYLEQQIYNNNKAIEDMDLQIKNLNKSIDGTADAINGISDNIDLLDEKINDLKESYDKATESKDRFLNTSSNESANSSNNKKNYKSYIFGTRYVANGVDSKDEAVSTIYEKVKRNWNGISPVSKQDILNNLEEYASGTSYSKNGLAIVDEDGLGSEFILKKGRLDYLPEGSVVFNKDETNALKELANSKDKVKQILNNADYYDYFKSHINGTNSNMNLSDLNKTRDLLSGTLCKNNNEYNMPINIVVNNAQGLNENQLGKIIRKEFYQEIKKVQSWRG